MASKFKKLCKALQTIGAADSLESVVGALQTALYKFDKTLVVSICEHDPTHGSTSTFITPSSHSMGHSSCPYLGAFPEEARFTPAEAEVHFSPLLKSSNWRDLKALVNLPLCSSGRHTVMLGHSTDDATMKQVLEFTKALLPMILQKVTNLRSASLGSFPLLNLNPIFRCDMDGVLTYANHAAEEILQRIDYQPGMNLFRPLLDCERVPKLSQFHRETEINGQIYAIDAVTIAEDEKVNLYFNDITAHHENKIFTDSILASVGEMLLVVGDANEIVFANDQVEKVLRYTSDEILGNNIFDILTFEDIGPQDFRSLFRTNNYREASAHMVDRDGQDHPVLITTRHLDRHGVEQPEILIAAKDARESRLLNELRSTQEQLIQSGKLAALGEMAAGIAHEINNPVAIIHAASEILELLAQTGKLTEEIVLKNATEIRETSLRISNIVKGLRTISRDATQDELLETTLQTVIEDAMGLCQEKVKMAGIFLSMDLPEDPVFIKARPSEISQVIINMFNNSIDAMESQETKMVHISAKQREGQQVILRFADNGPGIPEHILDEIFHPFFTTKDPGKGTGLGLSITKKIINSHDGEISAYNKDRGAVFEITLPYHEKSQKKAA